MTKRTMAAIAALPIFPIIAAAWAASAGADLPAGRSCVGYKTTKQMFLVATVDVKAVNCSLTINRDGAGNVIVTIPVDKFDSGSKKRDAHVAELLGGHAKAPLLFEFLEPTAFELAASSFEADGALTINGRPSPIHVMFVREQDGSLAFQMETKLSALGVTVPKVALGLVATPSDEITLYGRAGASDDIR